MHAATGARGGLQGMGVSLANASGSEMLGRSLERLLYDSARFSSIVGQVFNLSGQVENLTYGRFTHGDLVAVWLRRHADRRREAQAGLLANRVGEMGGDQALELAHP